MIFADLSGLRLGSNGILCYNAGIMKNMRQGIYIAPNRCRPWNHELHVAEILARNGHYVEFLPEGLLPCADILLDGVEFEIKSPERFTPNTLEHTIKDALKQSPNIIIDMSRIKKVSSAKMLNFLLNQVRKSKQIKCMLLITRQEEIIDVKAFLWYNAGNEALQGAEGA